jgi:putative SOS response-associated peptidase YedK
MCGRYTLHVPGDDLVKAFNLAEAPELPFRYNISPMQAVPVVRLDGTDRRLSLVRWGLVPRWAKDSSRAAGLIIARSETVEEKPTFRDAFRKRRCLIPADGFHEWKATAKGKQPFYFQGADGRPFAFAGLWERWHPPEGEQLETCTILTTRANELVAPLHERMPVILQPSYYADWLDPACPADRLHLWLRPVPADVMTAVPVSTRVNNAWNEGPERIALQVGLA